MDRQFLYENLLEWIRSFEFVEYSSDISNLLDGEILSEILCNIESNFFTEEWKNKFTFDSSSNWRLKASNLKKVVNTMTEFLKTNLSFSLDNFQYPDVNKICESSDTTEMSRLLQLLLLCAVNCSKKEMYIQHIMALESAVQLSIMNAIQELSDNETMTESNYESDDKLDVSHGQFQMLSREKEQLKQKNHELELKISLMNEEKAALEAELKRYKRGSGDSKTMKLLADATFESAGNSSPESLRIRQLQDKVASLQGEIYQLEHFKDNNMHKMEQLENENMELKNKIETLDSQVVDQRGMKDELDITKERLKTLSGLEATLEKYKKHIDNSAELTRQNKQLEIENSNYLERIFKLEEEARKSVSFKSQIEMYKSEISEIQSICSQKEKDFNKADFELKRSQDKLKGLEHDKMNLQTELKKLKEENEDLHIASYTLGSESSSEPNSESHDGLGNPSTGLDDSLDLMQIPFSMRERIIRLQKEVRQLRQLNSRTTTSEIYEDDDGNSQFGSGKNREQLLVSLEAAQARVHQLVTENKQLHQENLYLNAQIEDGDMGRASQGPNSAIEKVRQEKLNLENQYKGYLEKAKYVIYQLHRRLKQLEDTQTSMIMNHSGINRANSSEYIDQRSTPTGDVENSGNDTIITRAKYEALQRNLYEKQREMDELQKQFERSQNLHEEEEKMVVAAWYNLGVRLNREASQDRLRGNFNSQLGGGINSDGGGSSIDSSASPSSQIDLGPTNLNSNEPHSFLARQRIAHLITTTTSVTPTTGSAGSSPSTATGSNSK